MHSSESVILTDRLTYEAREAGSFLAAIARARRDSAKSLAFLAGGGMVAPIRC